MTVNTPVDVSAVRAIIIDILELEDDELTNTSLFIEDHGADSLGAIEILSRIEKELGVVLPQDDLVKLIHLDAVLEVLATAERRQP
ncbi:acyl carrier protein [Streptomyces sp. TRM66268-LWL]|uniref:Acyl carrier protein n=1 Tax=Streptomyces polyasparticus TaxID=2767826 RepID=A0ABR7S6B9_9ACTN|nr:acyl carrier protein [Streptomyces polyasparticus]MBC9710973.1 acyl carrier protein [Streptomyces polyasparticus]